MISRNVLFSYGIHLLPDFGSRQCRASLLPTAGFPKGKTGRAGSDGNAGGKGTAEKPAGINFRQ